MSTRSTIAIELEDGSIDLIYCHFDGYIEHNGKILFESYQDKEKIKSLINLGDLSYLAADIGNKHDFNKPNRSFCLFYGRDRGETNVEKRSYINMSNYLLTGQKEQYNYLYRNNEWYCSKNSQNTFFSLKNIFNNQLC